MKKRLLSMALALAILCTMLPQITVNADAAATLPYAPYAKIEYGYTTEASTGTIRYISQIRGDGYFNQNYWPTAAIDPDGDGQGYFGPGNECGTASISMALSYVGVNQTPKTLLETNEGLTGRMWTTYGSTQCSSLSTSASSISNAMNDYINGNGKYSPLVIGMHPYPSSGNQHFVILAGKVSENNYWVVDPAMPNGWIMTVSDSTASLGWTNGSYPITSVHQWHNPNATPPLVNATYPAYCTIKVSSSTTYVKSLPCSEDTDSNSKNVESGPAKKGDTYQAIGLVENKFGNLWYKVKTKNGLTGYMYAGEATYVDYGTDDITAPGVTVPANHTQGNTYVLSGEVTSIGNRLTNISAYVYSGTNTSATPVTGDNADVDLIGKSYSLGGSPIDYNTYFNHLPVGKYTYVVSASYENYYAVSAKKVSLPNKETVVLYKATFNVTSGTASCSHSYSSNVTSAATCVKNGTRTYTCSKCGHSYTETIAATGTHNYVGEVTANAYCGGTGTKTYTCTGCSASYTETIPATGEHTWGGWGVRTAATCTTSGTKARKCPVCYQEETQTIPATGHSYGSWITTTEAGCTTTGTQKKTCSSCGDVQTQSISATGHNYKSETIPANCTEAEKIRYTCQNCGDRYDKHTGEEYSDWSTTKPTGVAENLIESKTQYRYADYQTTTSYETSLSGYSQISSTWQNSGSGTVQYVKSWPSGFSTGHGLYATYNKSAKSASETTTDKTTINSDKIVGYLYYHWCRGTYMEGPINRGTRPTQTGEFNSFHAYYSTTAPSSLTASSDGDGSYIHGNSSCCKDSHWYYCVPVYEQSYTTYRKLFTYGQWNAWSAWSDTVYTACSTRKVETQTLYRYINTQLGEHVWNNGVVTTTPGCATTGEKIFTCTACGTTRTESVPVLGHNYTNGYCSRCDAKDPDYQFLTANVQIDWVSVKPGDFVVVPVTISSNPGFAGFTFVVDYDSTVMTLDGIVKGEVLHQSSSGSFVANTTSKTVSWTDVTNTTENGALFYLTFEISDHAASGNYSIRVDLKNGSKTNFVDKFAHPQYIMFSRGNVFIADVCAAVTHEGSIMRYKRLADAVDAAPTGSTITLLHDVEENVQIRRSCTLDLNGFNLVGNVTAASGVTVFVKDSQTDDYTVDDDNHYGKINGSIVCVQAADGYMMIEEADGVSFHRFDLQVTSMVLRASAAGIYYDCRFAGDEVIAQQVDFYGVALSLASEPTADVPGTFTKYNDFVSGDAGNAVNGTLLSGVMKTANTEYDNAKNAEMAIYGRAYILTKDEQYIYSDCVARTFRQQVELVDDQWSNLTNEQQQAVLDMYRLYQVVMDCWDIPNLQAVAQ